jgi:type I restriction enzyme M protein
MMKELKLDNIIPVEAITSRLWSVFDVLRNEPVSSEDYHLILFLLTIYKDGYLHDAINAKPNDVRYSIEDWIRKSDVEHYHQIIEISGAFNHSLERLSNRALHEIINILFSINIDELKLHFSDIFDNLLYRLAKSQGRYGGEFIQPIELSRLVCNLADLESNSTVFNPFAGAASFGVFLDEGQSYFGQEINYTTWAIGALRLLAYERPNESKYVKDDSILHWPNDNQKFDLVVSNPPYGLRLGNNYRGIYPEYRTAEQLLIEKGISSLTHKGKLIAILPNGFLFRGGSEMRLREHLVESDLVDSIIALPGGLLLNTGMPLVILVLNKAKRMPGVVKFIDAKNYLESKGSREKRLNDYALLSVLNKDQESDSVRIVSINQIRELEYNLSVPRYFQKSFVGVKLFDILEYVRGRRITNVESGKLIRIRDLKDDKLDYFLDEKSGEESELRRPDIRVIEDSVLLLAVRWQTLKPTFFNYTGTPILIPNDIIAFKVNDSVVNIGYLVNELHADYVQEQLESCRIGDTIPFIRKDDLLDIKIKLPSLNEQIAKVQGIEELSNKIKSLQEERNALAHGRSNSRFNEFASLKHTLGRPRQNILDWSDNLIHFLSDKGKEIDNLNKSFAEFYDIDMLSALNEIKRDVNFMSEILEKGENGLVVNDYPLKLVSLSDINALVNEITHNGFKFKIKKLPLKGEKLKERGIECNPTLLRTLIDNILTNANKHGYAKKDISNEVVIELTVVDEQLILEIKNNGKSFPKNFDKEKFISKYSTANPDAGSGLGGYDVNRIAQYFYNPTWELILNEDPIYPVKFKFQFSLKFMK